jgi:hypothetical protein
LTHPFPFSTLRFEGNRSIEASTLARGPRILPRFPAEGPKSENRCRKLRMRE